MGVVRERSEPPCPVVREGLGDLATPPWRGLDGLGLHSFAGFLAPPVSCILFLCFKGARSLWWQGFAGRYSDIFRVQSDIFRVSRTFSGRNPQAIGR